MISQTKLIIIVVMLPANANKIISIKEKMRGSNESL